MKRTTIVLELPDDLAARLEAEAARTERSVAEVVEGLVASGLENVPVEELQRRLPYAALGASGLTDTAERAKEILRAEWPDAIAGDG